MAENGRTADARTPVRADPGAGATTWALLAEEYDVQRRRQVGNFPQAFSHLTLVLAAHAITNAEARAGT